MKRTIARRTRRAYFLVLLVPFVLGILVFWVAEYYRTSMRLVSHTQEVLGKVDELLLYITRAESLQRGYLLTGEARYIWDMQNASTTALERLSELREITSDNARQVRRLKEVEPLVVSRLQKLHELVSLRDTPAWSVAAAIPLMHEGTRLMIRVRALLSGVMQDENRLMAVRVERLNSAEVQLALSFTIGLLINVSLLFRAYKVLVRYGDERDLAEAEIRELNNDLERRVEERTSELQKTNEQLTRSNDDLSRFAHVASHDLQEPLRTVASYAGLLERRYGSKMEGDAKTYVDLIVSGAKRMQNLVQDLLRYSRTGVQSIHLEVFNLGVLLEEVKDDLYASIAEHKAELVIGPLPRIRADRAKVLVVIENLVANALKFGKPGVPPKIELDANTSGDDWLITVKDNGIGFEAEFSEKIFVIFQRLHSVGVYPGTGIGLAICKRIVESHGGRIWATSEIGVGSTFSFTIPKGERIPLPVSSPHVSQLKG